MTSHMTRRTQDRVTMGVQTFIYELLKKPQG